MNGGQGGVGNGIGGSQSESDCAPKSASTRPFLLAAVVLSDPVVEIVRRELGRLAPEVRIDTQEIRTALKSEVLKREVAEGEQAAAARERVARAAGQALRVRAERYADEEAAALRAAGTDSAHAPTQGGDSE